MAAAADPAGAAATVDHLIIGAGAAGALVAARLGADRGRSVTLLEAGGSDRRFWVPIPIGYARLVNDPSVNWGYRTEPEAGLAGRRIPWPRGKLLGGSASINGLVWLRGAPADFDGWARAGATGWDYAEVLPVFRQLERYQVPGVDPRWHGFAGPMPVSAIDQPSAVARAFVDACVQLGYPRNDDFNGERLDGAGFLPLNTERGRRRTSAMTLLRPAIAAGARIDLRLGADVRRILFDGRRACGVEIRRDDGRLERLHCRGELILAAGAINSPQLLLRSGVGDAETLRSLGIPPTHHLPGVGAGLQDHLMARFAFRARHHDTLNDIMQSRWRQLRMGLDYALRRRGPMAISAAEASLFARFDRPGGTPPDGDPDDKARGRVDAGPDVQFQVANFSLDSYQAGLHPFAGFVYSACVCRPQSRGRIRLDPADPQAAPLIEANYLTTEHDRQLMLAAFRLGRRIAATEPIRGLIESEHRPGVAVNDDAALLDYIRNTASTTFHPCGSNRMGTDAGAVVDPQLRVHGLTGLRVIDASVMPVIPSTNIHAATLMIAERGAQWVRQA